MLKSFSPVLRMGGSTLALTLLLASCASNPTSLPSHGEARFKVLGLTEIVVGESAGIQPQNLTKSALQLKTVSNTYCRITKEVVQVDLSTSRINIRFARLQAA
ncbi:hypothetical protein [Deinococcus roseus]|uniref:Uncharacterized protein n=1 Tax=Deinococcus roseus TaxID=392414 RepID=A0ABQ2DJL7_9DEIO|nr:hypothetical protein [Deinococcus roseus]GGJ60188.1 hypothetical protein GCM10008938_52870 [Deinococcus roseus]